MAERQEDQLIHVPDIGGATDVTVIDLLVSVGDQVKVDDPLVTLEGDKATMDIPRGNETILFVDDEISIIKMVQRMFERLGYKVETATTPEEALDRFSLNPDHFDLVITDIMMPEQDGIEILKQIRDDDDMADMKVIIVSSKSFEFDRRQAMKMGAA